MNDGINADKNQEMAKPIDPPILREMRPTTSEVGHAPMPDQIPLTVEAPVLVVPPGTVSTGGGLANTGNVDAGKDFVGRDSATSTSDTGQRFSSSGSNVTFSREDNSKLWEANMKLLQDIANVAYKLDDIPDRIKELERMSRVLPVTIPVTIPVAVPIAPVTTAPITSTQSWLLIGVINLVVIQGGIIIWLLLNK